MGVPWCQKTARPPPPASYAQGGTALSSEVAVHVAVGERNPLADRLYPHRRPGVESASFGYDDRYLADQMLL